MEELLGGKAFKAEVERIHPQLGAVGQDPAKFAEETFPVLAKPAQEVAGGRLRFRFLCSPQSIHAGPDGRINRLRIVENVLQQRDGSIACKATDKTADLQVDTMTFPIGDVAHPAVGLPDNLHPYVTNS